MSFYDSFFAILLAAAVLIAYVVLRREMQSQVAELRKQISEAAKPAVAPPPFVPIAVASAAAAAAAAPAVSAPSAPVVSAPAAAASKLELVKKETLPVAAPVKAAKEDVTPEILAVIAAAVAQFVGAGARIRRTRVIPITESNAWAQQGRVIIQASHNLGVR